MKSPSSENSIISSKRSFICSSEYPSKSPERNMFSYPDSFLWNPTPIERRDILFPCKSIVPLSGEKMPAIALKIVDFPLPFFPHIPTICPFGISKETSLIAWKVDAFTKLLSPDFAKENLFGRKDHKRN